METISIIVPIYNVEKYIYDCLNSVANQTFTNIECLLIDDKGLDNSIDIAKEFIATYRGNIKFKIISHEINLGLSEARNTGIKHSKGEYLFFLDSDDEISPNCIELLYDIAKKNSSDFVIGNITIKGESAHGKSLQSSNFLPTNRKKLYSNKEIVKAYFRNQWFVMAWNKLIKREFILNNKLWFPKGLLHEDHYWSFKLASCANRMSICKQHTYIYKLRPDSITGKITERNISHMIEILRLCNIIANEKKCLYLKGKVRSIANYIVHIITSSIISKEKKINLITMVKNIADNSFPLSISDTCKLVLLCLPSKFIYKVIYFYQQRVNKKK